MRRVTAVTGVCLALGQTQRLPGLAASAAQEIIPYVE